MSAVLATSCLARKTKSMSPVSMHECVCVWKLKIMALLLSSLLLSLLNFIYGITARFLSAIRHYMECKTYFIL